MDEAKVIEMLESLHAKVDRLLSAKPTANAPEIADAADLDGQYGNPVVKKDPPRWDGDSFVGKKFSECSPEYLDAVSSFKLWQAKKDAAKGDDEGEKKSFYARKDASRAAGWAKRIRDGYVPQAASVAPGGDSDIPF